MKFRKTNLTGSQYLAAVTRLLQNIRLESATSGLYEAADLQWWWREDDADHSDRQLFWLDETDNLVACLLRFHNGNEWLNDFFFLPSVEEVIQKEVYPEVISIISSTNHPSTITVRDDDFTFQQLLVKNGFVASPVATVQTLLGKNPTPMCLPNGFQLYSREQEPSGPHHMINRGGPNIASKLAECSLYRPDLDLVIRDIKGDVAAYALFWMDPVTKVGLLEPMRTEATFQRLGLAKYLISEGIRRLQTLGANDIKVSYKIDNEAAKKLYHQCGFRDQFVRPEYQKTPESRRINSSG